LRHRENEGSCQLSQRKLHSQRNLEPRSLLRRPSSTNALDFARKTSPTSGPPGRQPWQQGRAPRGLPEEICLHCRQPAGPPLSVSDNSRDVERRSDSLDCCSLAKRVSSGLPHRDERPGVCEPAGHATTSIAVYPVFRPISVWARSSRRHPSDCVRAKKCRSRADNGL